MKKYFLALIVSAGCSSVPKPKGTYQNTQTQFQQEMLQKYSKPKK